MWRKTEIWRNREMERNREIRQDKRVKELQRAGIFKLMEKESNIGNIKQGMCN